jgi:hypothetical protein
LWGYLRVRSTFNNADARHIDRKRDKAKDALVLTIRVELSI